MSIHNIASPYSTIFNLDEILQDIPETATEKLSDIEGVYQSYKEELGHELKTTDRVWLEFHAGQCEQYGKFAKSILYRIVKASVGLPENCIAAANAITILKVMKVSFSCLDLRGVQIPGADLSGAILDKADLSGADLESANLANASLNGTNMLGTKLKKAKFDVPNIFIHRGLVYSSIISPDKKYLISEDHEYLYYWYLPSKTRIKIITKSTMGLIDYEEDTFSEKKILLDGQLLFTYDIDRNINIWSLDSFKFIKKIELYNKRIDVMDVLERVKPPCMSLSSDGKRLITYKYQWEYRTLKTQLKFCEIQKKENNLLDIILRNEVIMPFEIFKVCFSEKFSVFYCFEEKFSTENTPSDEKTIYLSVYSADKFFKVTNADEMNNSFVNLFIPLVKKSAVEKSICYSLAIADTRKDTEELLFIAIDNFIFSVHILKNNKQNWSLEWSQITDVITEIDTISDMQILVKTHELIYLCNESICLYSIKNNQLIGKFRLVDTKLEQFFISSDEANISISSLRKIYTFSIDALKNSNNVFYQMDNNAMCFLADMRSIISISSSSYMASYDIETGNIMRSELLQKMHSPVSNKRFYKVLFSRNTQHTLIYNDNSPHFLHIINTENEKPFFEIFKDIFSFVLNHSSEYLALINSIGMLIYKTIPSKQCIGQFYIADCRYTELMAISKDFLSTPKVVLKSDFKMTILNFVFKDEVLALVSQKELPRKPSYTRILQIQFIKNDSKLIVVYEHEFVILDIEHDQHEKYDIRGGVCECADISQDGSLLAYYEHCFSNYRAPNYKLYLWSITQKKTLITQTFFLPITKLHISSDNRYIVGTVRNGGMYVWKIVGDTFRLLWRTSHNLQTQGLKLGNNNLEKDVEEDLVAKMGALKIADTEKSL